MTGLAQKTSNIFEKISVLDCIKPYILVGGTALALQLGTRKSEDLDFMSWKTSKKDSPEVAWNLIAKELETIGEIENVNLLGFDHVEFVVSGVKISFYACDKFSPVDNTVNYLNNIRLADITSIGAMKMEVMLRRTAFRDYYDIYSILKHGIDINTLISKAIEYSRYRLKTKNLLSILTNCERFAKDSGFGQLEPLYDITPKEIELFIRSVINAKK